MLFFKFTGLYKKINFVFLYKSSSNRKWKIKSKNTSLKKTKKGLWVKVYQVGKQTRPESGWNFTRLKKKYPGKKTK